MTRMTIYICYLHNNRKSRPAPGADRDLIQSDIYLGPYMIEVEGLLVAHRFFCDNWEAGDM